MIANLVEFNAALHKWAKTVPVEEVQKLATYLALEGLKRIVLKTPVDTGLARGNWQVSIGKSGKGTIKRKDKSGQVSITTGSSKILSAPKFPFISIFNDLPYIAVLEFGGFIPANPGPSKDPRIGRFGRILVRDGFSVQAPQGMVYLTISELRKVLPA